jgi:hypothetical protein
LIFRGRQAANKKFFARWGFVSAGAAIRPSFSNGEEEMSFSMIVGRYEIVATSGVGNGSVRVGKSEAQAYDVIDRKRSGHARLEKQGVTLDTAWFYCIRRQASAQGVSLLH